MSHASSPSVSSSSYRRKGLLAFLEETATLFPYDADAMRKETATTRVMRQSTRRQRRRQRRRHPVPEDDDDGSCDSAILTTTTTLSETLADRRPHVVILFFYDPQQPHSVQVRDRIVRLVEFSRQRRRIRRDDHHHHHNRRGDTDDRSADVLCCAVTMNTGNRRLERSTVEFLRGTGMLATGVAASARHAVFNPRLQQVGVPHLMLVKTDDGRNFGGSHEDVALEWNPSHVVYRRWTEEGISGLDCGQKVLSEMLFPTGCSIL